MVSGNIKDESAQPVAYVNVLLMKAQDSTIVSGSTTDDHGIFKLNNVQSGSYVLKASFIGYQDIYLSVNVSDNDKTLPVIILKEIGRSSCRG